MSITEAPKLPVAVNKATPYNFDLGLLLATDPNPVSLPSATSSDELEQALAEVARDGTQALINQLLTTCPVNSTPDGVALSLPGATTPLPREKPLPTPKAMTKWQKFAAKKGIAPKTREQRRNITFDEDSGIWRPKWGHGGLNKKGEDAPIVEVDMKKEREAKEGTSVRAEGRRERKENLKRNQRMQRKNERAAEQKR